MIPALMSDRRYREGDAALSGMTGVRNESYLCRGWLDKSIRIDFHFHFPYERIFTFHFPYVLIFTFYFLYEYSFSLFIALTSIHFHFSFSLRVRGIHSITFIFLTGNDSRFPCSFFHLRFLYSCGC